MSINIEMRGCVSVLIFVLVLCLHYQASNGANVDDKSKPWLQSSNFMAFKVSNFNNFNILFYWTILYLPQTKFKKSFKDDNEAAKRFAIFKENYDQIAEHNKKNTSYTQRIYDYHDRTLDEFRNTKLGLKLPR